MACEQIREALIGCALGGAPLAEGGPIDTHLAACPACRAEFQRLSGLTRAIDDGLAALVSDEPSPALLARVRMNLENRPAPSFSSRLVWGMTLASLAVAVVLIGWRFWPRAPHVTGSPVAGVLTPPASVVPSLPLRPAASPAKRNSTGPIVAAHPRRAAPAQPDRLHVVVRPGERAGVVALAQAIRSGRLDAGNFASDYFSLDRSLEIKPLVIAPLAAALPPLASPGDAPELHVAPDKSK